MNKLFGLFLLALSFLAPSVANSATCFWVGGTGSINDVTHWSSGTGGAGSTCASAGGWPNASTENGTFDASSGGGTITRNVAWTIGTLNIAAFTGTFGNSGDSSTVLLDSFTNNGSGTRTLNLGASTWTCGHSGASCVWQFSGHSNLTLNGNTSTVVMDDGGASGVTGGGTALCWFGSSLTYNNITFNVSNVAVANHVGYNCNNGNLTIANLTIGANNTIEFQGSATWTITGTMAFSGGTPSASAVTYLYPDGPGTTQQFTLSGGAATCNWCALRGIIAVTNAITANNSLNLGKNTNVTVNAPSGGGGSRGIIGG